MSELLNELATIAGPGGLLTGDEVSSRASGIWRSDGIQAQAIVRPRDTEQVSRILKLCNKAWVKASSPTAASRGWWKVPSAHRMTSRCRSSA